jgi:hypothetical protein
MVGILSAVAVLMVFFIPVFAEERYPIWVGDQTVTSTVTSGEGWSYDGNEDGGTLTLTNATFSNDTYYGIYTSVPLKIVLVGNNKMEEGLAFGIYSTSELTIEGEGSLEVSGTAAGIYANGLNIKGTNITAKSNDLGLKCEKWHRFNISDSTVECDAVGCGIFGNGCRIIITNSKITTHGGDSGIISTALEIHDGSTVVAESDDRVAMVAPEEFVMTDSDVIAKGKTLGVDILTFEMNGGKFRASGSEKAVSLTYRTILGDEMHIVLPEGGSVQSVYEEGNWKYFFANSDGSYATDVFVRDSKVKAVTNGPKDLVTIDKPMADEGDMVTVTVKNTFYHILKNITAKDSDGQTVSLQDGGEGKYTFSMPEKDVTVNVEFGQPDKYPVWIGEHQVTGDNDSGEGWSCAVDEKGATLTLNGINLEYSADAVKSDIPLTVVLVGKNNLGTTSTSGITNSINAGSSLAIKGEGSLSLKGTLNGGSDIKISDGAKINILDSTNGIKTTSVLTIDDSVIDIKGKINAIYVIGGTVKITNSTVSGTVPNSMCIDTETITIDSSIVSLQGMYGIFAKNFTVENGSALTINSESFGAFGNYFSSCNSKINITAQKADALSFLKKIELISGTVSVKSIKYDAVNSSDGTLTLGENMKITVPEDGQISSDGKTIVDANNEIAKEVVIKGTFHVTVDGRSRVTIDKTDFTPGEAVDFSIWADDKFVAFKKLKVTDQNGDPIEVTDNGDRTYSFIMPESAVTLRAEFEDAEVYELYIAGESVTSFANSGEGWKYVGDKMSGTLYLENAQISDNYTALRTNVALTIVLKGDNVVDQKYGGNAILSDPAITIKGDGSLSVKGPYGGIYAGGITICDGATVTAEGEIALNSTGKGMSITDSKVIAKATNTYALLDSSTGTVNNIVIKNSNVECSSNYNAAINTSVVTIDNSTVKASGNNGFYGLKTLSVLNGSDLTVDSKYEGINGGTIIFRNSSVHFESEYAYPITGNGITIDGGSVYAKGKYRAIASNSQNLSLSENMVITIPENGKLNDQKYTIVDSEGVTATEVLIKQGYKVTVVAGDNGTASASVASGLEGTEVTVTADPVEGYELDKITYTPKGGSAVDITSGKKFKLKDSDVTVNVTFKPIVYKITVNTNGMKDIIMFDKTAPVIGDTVTVTIEWHFYWSVNSISAVDANGQAVALEKKSDIRYTFTMPASDITLNVEMVHPDRYPVWIEGQLITSLVSSGDGWKCVIDEEGATLTLTNATLTCDERVIVHNMPLTIVLEGENKVISNGNFVALESPSPLVIKGKGSLYLKGLDGLDGNHVTICDGATIVAEGKEYGIRMRGYYLSVTDSTITAKGEYGIDTGTDDCYIKNSKITAAGSKDSMNGKDISISNSSLTVNSDEGTGMNYSGKIEIKGGNTSINAKQQAIMGNDIAICDGATVVAEGELYGIGSDNKTITISDSTVTAKGQVYSMFDVQGSITIKNSTFNGSSVHTYVIYAGHLTIDNSVVEANGASGMAGGDLSLINGSKLTINSDYFGLGLSDFAMSDSSLTINSNTNANAAFYFTDLKINSGYFSVTGNRKALERQVEYSPEGTITLGENMVIVTPENGKFDDDKTTILDADGNIAKIVVIKQNYKVTATAGGNGKAKASVASGFEGTKVTLTATPDDGYIFKEWKVVKGGVKLADPKNATTTFTIGTADVEVKAVFAVKPAPQVTLKLDKKSASVICGNTTTIKATLTGSKDKVTWKSSDTKIATVDANGKVTTKMAGTVTITASAAGKKAACTVTVLYKDVTDSKEFWYAPTNYLTKNGIVKGYDNQTLFKPANECSRAQMVTFLWRLAGQPNPKKTTTDFKDIKTTDYFYKPVLWAVEMGITTGVSKEKFNPQGICTRAQTVTFLWRMAGKPAPKSKDCKFTDIKTTEYFYKATLWASEMKIVAGYDDNTFRPQGKCLRRQMVTFLYKYDKYVNGKG